MSVLNMCQTSYLKTNDSLFYNSFFVILTSVHTESVNWVFQSGRWCNCVMIHSIHHRYIVVMSLQVQIHISLIFLNAMCVMMKMAINASVIRTSNIVIVSGRVDISTLWYNLTSDCIDQDDEHNVELESNCVVFPLFVLPRWMNGVDNE